MSVAGWAGHLQTGGLRSPPLLPSPALLADAGAPPSGAPMRRGLVRLSALLANVAGPQLLLPPRPACGRQHAAGALRGILGRPRPAPPGLLLLTRAHSSAERPASSLGAAVDSEHVGALREELEGQRLNRNYDALSPGQWQHTLRTAQKISDEAAAKQQKKGGYQGHQQQLQAPATEVWHQLPVQQQAGLASQLRPQQPQQQPQQLAWGRELHAQSAGADAVAAPYMVAEAVADDVVQSYDGQPVVAEVAELQGSEGATRPEAVDPERSNAGQRNPNDHDDFSSLQEQQQQQLQPPQQAAAEPRSSAQQQHQQPPPEGPYDAGSSGGVSYGTGGGGALGPRDAGGSGGSTEGPGGGPHDGHMRTAEQTYGGETSTSAAASAVWAGAAGALGGRQRRAGGGAMARVRARVQATMAPVVPAAAAAPLAAPPPPLAAPPEPLPAPVTEATEPVAAEDVHGPYGDAGGEEVHGAIPAAATGLSHGGGGAAGYQGEVAEAGAASAVGKVPDPDPLSVAAEDGAAVAAEGEAAAVAAAAVEGSGAAAPLKKKRRTRKAASAEVEGEAAGTMAEAAAEGEAAAAPGDKPKKRRKPRAAVAVAEGETAVAQAEAEAAVADGRPLNDSDAAVKPKRKRKAKVVEAEGETAAAEGSAEGDAPAKPAKRLRKPKAAAPEAEGEAADGEAAAAKAPKKPRKPKAAAVAAPEAADDAAAAVITAPAPPSYLLDGVLPPPQPVPIDGGFYFACEGFATKQPLTYRQMPPDVLVVNTPEVARAVVDRLFAAAATTYPGSRQRKNPPVACRYFACDTEVAFIDVTTQTPIGHGAVLCFSIYGGDDLDFSDCQAAAATGGPAEAEAAAAAAAGPAVRKDRIWVDIWDEIELDAEGRPIMDGRYVRLKPQHPILEAFRRFFEDEHTVKKVWHNYGFDRHVLENMGVRCAGFGGDTLHMARLADASRSGKRTYGLDNLTSDPKIMKHFTPYQAAAAPRERTGSLRRRGAVGGPGSGDGSGDSRSPGAVAAAQLGDAVRAKLGMKERFGMFKLRAGSVGKVAELPPIHKLQLLELFRPTWIDYSALDAKATWQLREALEAILRGELWELERSLAKQLGYAREDSGGAGGTEGTESWRYLNLWHYYCSYWLDFGELLTTMERRGMMVNRAHLAAAQVTAEADRKAAVREFLDWADSKVPGARYMNVGSGAQIRLLLFPDFAGFTTKAAAGEAAKAKSVAARAARSGAPPPGIAAEPAAAPGGAAAAAAKPEPEPGCRVIKVPNPHYEEELARGLKPSKYTSIVLHGIWGRGVAGRLQPEVLTATNAAAVSIVVLRGLAGKPGAARKELAKLLEQKAAAAAAAAVDAGAAAAAVAAAMEARAAADRTVVPLVGDALDESLAVMQGAEEGEAHGGGGEEAAAEEEAEAEEGSSEEDEGGALRGAVPVVDDPERLAALEAEAKAKGLGRLFAACGGGEEGLRACVAVEALCEVNAIDKLLSAFIIPLQGDSISTTTRLPVAAPAAGAEPTAAVDSTAASAAASAATDGLALALASPSPSPSSSAPGPPYREVHRVHCSLNINTETGRLSARRPNLQNQPALEKDRYKVRRAFTADTASGRTLVVADYGQLELRILAHITDCKSMREAFELGGDFHSRTAYGMYDYIKQDVANGGCYLEWEGAGEPDKPLVKDKYASERRKAKVLNFSIAYGKTAHGLANDFKTSREEAQATVDRWYADRFEVRKWQEETREEAKESLKVRTLLGRTRPLPNMKSPDFKLSGRSGRAAINTPIQGSAADVAAAAMVAIEKSEELRATGFELLMQIHDEVILEGPSEHSGEAKRLVMQLMANPWAELSKHWNAAGARGLMQGEEWHRLAPELPGGHVAGVWRHGAGSEGGGGGGAAMPLLVELATDCNVADTWYEAK